MRFAIFLLLVTLTLPALADWHLLNERSSLHFVTVKATHVAETHQFHQLSGAVDSKGQATLVIDLGSVDTSIEVRDERMKEMLFEVMKYPTATLTVTVDPDILKLKAGKSEQVELSGNLSLHGKSIAVVSQAEVVGLAGKAVRVTSIAPLLINAGEVGLVAGIEKLREVAGLPSISHTVVVTYDLVYEEK